MAVPLVHQTDLFRPHQDPDDHWDLLCVHALHQLGAIDASAILIDYPPLHHGGKPDLPGIEMLTAITGVSIPFAVGGAAAFGSSGASDAADLLIRILESSAEPIVVDIAGSCRDVAIALSKRPGLFADNCKAIYLNAGTGYAESGTEDEIEYNVRLDRTAYCAIFEAPCTVYWCPCFERLGVGLKTHTYGTRYRFRQGEILGRLAPPIQAYFAYMFSRETDTDWRRWLDPDRYQPLILDQHSVIRQMWTTAGLLHAAGMNQSAGFVFEPVRVTCLDSGMTTWKSTSSDSRVRIFRINDHELYENTMCDVLRNLAMGIDLTLA